MERLDDIDTPIDRVVVVVVVVVVQQLFDLVAAYIIHTLVVAASLSACISPAKIFDSSTCCELYLIVLLCHFGVCRPPFNCLSQPLTFHE